MTGRKPVLSVRYSRKAEQQLNRPIYGANATIGQER
jgi:hypothetical protein